MPRPLARSVGANIGHFAFVLVPRLRRAGYRNLELAFPEKTPAEREQILRAVYRNLGWLLAEFCQMGRYTPRTRSLFFATMGWSTISPPTARAAECSF